MTFESNPDREKSILRIPGNSPACEYQMREVRDATVDRDLQRGLSFSALAQAMGSGGPKVGT
jgi:hypothetical protein